MPSTPPSGSIMLQTQSDMVVYSSDIDYSKLNSPSPSKSCSNPLSNTKKVRELVGLSSLKFLETSLECGDKIPEPLKESMEALAELVKNWTIDKTNISKELHSSFNPTSSPADACR